MSDALKCSLITSKQINNGGPLKATTNTQSPILSGILTQFDKETGFGIVLTDNPAKSFSISRNNGPRMFSPGKQTPFFSGNRSTTRPAKNDLVKIFTLNENGREVAHCWGLTADWEKAEGKMKELNQPISVQSKKFMDRLQEAIQIQAAQKTRNDTAPKKIKPFSTVLFSSHCTA